MTTASTQGLRDLVQARAGLFNQEIPVIGAPGDPRFSIAVARLGDLRKILPGYAQGLHGDAVRDSLDGAGSGLEAEESSVRAVAEGLERYSSCVYDERQFIWATGNELGDSALDLATVPQCSEAELRHPRCPIHMPAISRGERFWMPISTGCADHTTIERALVSAICEVIERDAISLTWLHQLPLPRIEVDVAPEWLRSYLDRNARSVGVEQYFFDATTERGWHVRLRLQGPSPA